MHNHEAKSAELHFALLTHMRTSFLNPLPREDMYTLSRFLNEAMEKLDAAAELVLPLQARTAAQTRPPTSWKSSAARPN